MRPHRNGIVLVFHLLIWIFMPRDGQSAWQPLKPRVAYPHPAHPIKAHPRDMHKKGLKLTRNLSRLRMPMLCISITMPTWLTNSNVRMSNATAHAFSLSFRDLSAKVISLEMKSDRMIGPGALMIHQMSLLV